MSNEQIDKATADLQTALTNLGVVTGDAAEAIIAPLKKYVDSAVEETYAAAGRAAGVFLPAFDSLPKQAQRDMRVALEKAGSLGMLACYTSLLGDILEGMDEAL